MGTHLHNFAIDRGESDRKGYRLFECVRCPVRKDVLEFECLECYRLLDNTSVGKLLTLKRQLGTLRGIHIRCEFCRDCECGKAKRYELHEHPFMGSPVEAFCEACGEFVGESNYSVALCQGCRS